MVRSSNSSPVQVYCSTSITLSCNGVTGGWRRVAYLNTSGSGPIQCPTGLQVRSTPPSCRRSVQAPGCSSVFYSSYDIPYSCIYGKVNGLQTGPLDGFKNFGYDRSNTPTLEENYLDGISLTPWIQPKELYLDIFS